MSQLAILYRYKGFVFPVRKLLKIKNLKTWKKEFCEYVYFILVRYRYILFITELKSKACNKIRI